MRVTLGKGPRPVEEPSAVDLLLACHERIRGQLGLARALVDAARAPLALVEEAARDLVRYHTVALPLHQEDEERSVRPRLEAVAASPAVREALARMGAEHVELDAVLAELVPRWTALAAEPPRIATLASELAAPTAALGELWGRHLAGEETTVFPAVEALLSRAERDAIAGEIRARRRVAVDAPR